MDFDFNIKNYRTPELEDIFELPKGYSTAIVNSRETKLKQNILNNKTLIDNSIKNKLLSFVTEAKNRIIEEFSKNNIKIDTFKKTSVSPFYQGC
jgi:hypothetical protein